jgi:HSP20 family molecular chaperone IbpA
MTPMTTKNGEKLVAKEGTPKPLFDPFRNDPLLAEFFAPRRGFGTLADLMLQPRPAMPTVGFDLDLYEKNGKYIVECALPGFKRDEIELNVNGRELTITTKTTEHKEEKEARYFYLERYKGAYRRTIAFQEPIKAENVNALYQDGILRIEIPVPEVEKTKRIPIIAN